MRTVTKVEYLMPGAFFPEEGYLEVDTRDPDAVATRLPDSAYAFQVYTLTYLRATDELGNEVELPPTRSQESGWYYLDGTIFDLAHVRILAANDPTRYRTLLANMEGNGWERLVKCRTGNWQPFEPGDVLITSGGKS